MKKFLSYVVVFVMGFASCAYIIHRLPPYQGVASVEPVSYNPLAAPAALPAVRNDPKVVGTSLMADIAARTSPAVVNIDVQERRDPLQEDEWPFFRPPRQGQGTGFIIDRNGYILTNAHVVGGNMDIRVTLSDGRVFPGKVQGVDRSSDLAVVKINAANLPTLELGSSKGIRPGEWVIAIGNPLGYSHSVTAGIVSAVHRSAEPGRRGNLIQTDAAINPGNSGGPLIDMSGRVVGINEQIATTTGVFIGLGFAIPIDTAKEVLNDLITYGRAIRPWLGVVSAPVNSRIQQALGMPDMMGVLIMRLVPDGPAARGGIQQYDVIRQIGDMKITSLDDLREAIRRQKIGAVVPITLWREGRSITVRVRMEEMPDVEQ